MSATTEPAPVAAPAAVVAGSRPASNRREVIGLLLRSWAFVIGVVVVLFWIFWAIFGYHLAPDDPVLQGSDQLAQPSSAHWFGTDALSRDVLSRVLVGGRYLLVEAPLSVALAVILGSAIGLALGTARGWIDESANRVIDAVLAIPGIVFALTAIAAFWPTSTVITLTVGFLFAPIVARTVRAAVLAERDLDYVQAARLRGERTPYILFVEILPNVLAPIVVEATVRLGYAIFVIAGLTFIGLGVQPPTPDWARDVTDSWANLNAIDQHGYWWTVVFPSAAIMSLVIAIYLIADSLQRVLDR